MQNNAATVEHLIDRPVPKGTGSLLSQPDGHKHDRDEGLSSSITRESGQKPNQKTTF